MNTLLDGKKVLVVGAARSGMAAARFLLARGARVTLSDSAPLERLPAAADLARTHGVTVETGGHTVPTFVAQDLVVVSPGVPTHLAELAAARDAGVRVIGEVELASWFLQGRIVGITGSNGKTTTTALIGKILETAGYRVHVGGNIGDPLISQVEDSRPDSIHVVELSSFQLETTEAFRPHVAVVLNVTPDHLDRHASFDDYAAAKGRIFANQGGQDFAVLNADDAVCRAYAARTRAGVHWFSTRHAVDAGAFLQETDIVFRGPLAGAGAEAWTLTVMGAEEIPLKGVHNVENALAAVCAAALLGGDFQKIRAGVRAFRAVEHRLEYVATVGEVEFYNDSKATNVDAAIKALEAFPGNLLVILGGKDKGSDYRPLGPLLAARARQAFLIGQAADQIAEHLGAAVPLLKVGTLDAAVVEAFRRSRPGDVILLAPACASFDQFQNYEHRGRVFKELVAKLTGGAGSGLIQ